MGVWEEPWQHLWRDTGCARWRRDSSVGLHPRPRPFPILWVSGGVVPPGGEVLSLSANTPELGRPWVGGFAGLRAVGRGHVLLLELL